MLLKLGPFAGCLVALGMLGGCAGSHDRVEPPGARPLGVDIPAFQAPDAPDASTPPPPTVLEPTGDLTLRDALALALMRNPELAVFSWEARAQEARVLQAGLRPNPGLGLEVENFAGSGEFSGWRSAETTISLSQLLELGGKRGKRQRLAEANQNLAAWDYEAVRISVLTEVTKTFVSLLTAQHRLDLAEDLVLVAEQALESVSRRVEAGAVSPVEATRARVERSKSRLDQQIAVRALAAERKRLAAFWGGEEPRFARAAGSLEHTPIRVTVDSLLVRIEQNPDVARWAFEREQRLADLALQRALGTPDVEVVGGIRRLAESSDNAAVLGLAVPLPVFDRNQGSSREAEYRVARVEEEYRGAWVAARVALAVEFESFAAASQELVTLESEILPDAESALAAADEAYQKGLFRLTDVLDTRRTLFELRGRRFDALARYHQSVAEIERLIGEPLSAVGGSDDQE